MTRPIPDKAEVALEFPNKFYVGTFERTASFGAQCDTGGVGITLERRGDATSNRVVRMHFHYALFGEILREMAKSAAVVPFVNDAHRAALRGGAKALYDALADPAIEPAKNEQREERNEAARLTPGEEEVLLLHILE